MSLFTGILLHMQLHYWYKQHDGRYFYMNPMLHKIWDFHRGIAKCSSLLDITLCWMVSSYWHFKRKKVCSSPESHSSRHKRVRVKQSKKSGLLDPRDEGTTILQNLSNCLLINIVQHPRRVESLSPASS